MGLLQRVESPDQSSSFLKNTPVHFHEYCRLSGRLKLDLSCPIHQILSEESRFWPLLIRRKSRKRSPTDVMSAVTAVTSERSFHSRAMRLGAPTAHAGASNESCWDTKSRFSKLAVASSSLLQLFRPQQEVPCLRTSSR